MSLLTLLLSLAAVDLLAILSPGPNILLVTQTAVEQDRRRALIVGCGLAAASAVWAGIALTGLAVVFELVPSLETAIRIAGAGYLIYLGTRLWRAPAGTSEVDARACAVSPIRAFLRGFAIGSVNPKVLAYFGSIFVLFIPADASLPLCLAVLAVVVADGLLVYGAVALLLSRPAVRKTYLALRRPIDRACGALLMLFGLRLILGRI
jgi:threonine efflux protein